MYFLINDIFSQILSKISGTVFKSYTSQCICAEFFFYETYKIHVLLLDNNLQLKFSNVYQFKIYVIICKDKKRDPSEGRHARDAITM